MWIIWYDAPLMYYGMDMHMIWCPINVLWYGYAYVWYDAPLIIMYGYAYVWYDAPLMYYGMMYDAPLMYYGMDMHMYDMMPH